MWRRCCTEMARKSVPLLIALFLLFSLAEADGWELAKRKAGITVYTKSVEGSDFSAFRGETVVEGSVAAVVALLYDTPSAPEWLHQCRFGMTLEEVAFGDNYIFELYDLPFPVRDRQVVLHSILSLTHNGARLDISEANGFCDGKQLARCEKVRASGQIAIERSRGSYLFSAEGEGRTRVVCSSILNPAAAFLGGWPTPWLSISLTTPSCGCESSSKRRSTVR